MKTKQKMDELFKVIQTLDAVQRNSVLCFLCGWCQDDKEFVQGVENALSGLGHLKRPALPRKDLF